MIGSLDIHTILKEGLFKPFLIYRNEREYLYGFFFVAFLWAIFEFFDLHWDLDIDSFKSNGDYLLTYQKEIQSVGGAEWFLRATIGKLFTLVHMYFHISLIFSFSNNHVALQEKEYHDYSISFEDFVYWFIRIFPIAWYLIFLSSTKDVFLICLALM